MQNRKNNSLIKKLFFTLFIIAILRFINFIPIPYVEQQNIINLLNSNSSLQLFFNNKNLILNIFSIGIVPTLNASILMQFLINSVSYFKKLQKEEGQAGTQKIKQITRYLTLIFAIFQSFSVALTIKPILFNWNVEICLQIVLLLTTGSMIVLWLSDLISEIGIGNGSSIVLALNIIATLPNILPRFNEVHFNLITLYNFLAFLAVILGIIYIQETIKKIPLITINQLYRENRNDKRKIRQFSYLPLKLTQGAVMPIIFSSIILAFLRSLISNLLNTFNITFFTIQSLTIRVFFGFLNFLFITFFNQLYSNLIINPKEIAKDLNKKGVAIENVRPGKNTVKYLKKIINRLSILGGISLGILNCISQTNITYSSGFNITSLIILIGVSSEISRKIEDRNM